MPIFYNYPEKYDKISKDVKISCEGKELKCITTPVSAFPINQVWPGYQRPFEQTEPTTFITLSSNNEITLDITSAKAFEKVTVRPLSKNIKASIKGNSATVTFPGVGLYKHIALITLWNSRVVVYSRMEIAEIHTTVQHIQS